MEPGAGNKTESGAVADASVQRMVEDAERTASGVSELADSLVEYASRVKREADQLVGQLRDAAAQLSGSTASAAEDATDSPTTLSVGAQVLIAQLVVGGAGREDIEKRLHDEFGIDDTAGMLDAVLDP